MSERLEPELAALAAARPKVPPVSARLAAETANAGAVRTRRPRRQLAILVVASLVYAAGVLALLRIRADVAEVPLAWIATVAGAWLAGFVVTLALVVVPPRGSMFPRWQIARLVAIVAAIGFVTLGLLVHPSGPSSLIYGWENLVRGHACLEIGLGVALVPIIIGAIAMRRAQVVRPRTIAFALGAGSGCLGGLLLHFFCKIADGPHIGLIHGGVVAVAGLLTALVVPRVIDGGRRNISRTAA
ncbi:MAG: NrsF family protein [Kofleriaceae bacterium]